MINEGERQRIFLVGHSQGGAASAQVCSSSKIVAGSNIVGLLLLGSESPIEALPSRAQQYMALTGEEIADNEPPNIIHLERPTSIPLQNIAVIHSENDRVISSVQMEQLSRAWGCRYVSMRYPDRADNIHAPWAADVQHDFLSRDMLKSVLEHTIQMISET